MLKDRAIYIIENDRLADGSALDRCPRQVLGFCERGGASLPTAFPLGVVVDDRVPARAS